MVEELIALLSDPDNCECCWSNGELYIRCCDDLSELAPLSAVMAAAVLSEAGRSHVIR
jgi:hypothetical protein